MIVDQMIDIISKTVFVVMFQPNDMIYCSSLFFLISIHRDYRYDNSYKAAAKFVFRWLHECLQFAEVYMEKLFKTHNVREDWFQQPQTSSKLQFPLTLRCSCRRFQYRQYLLLSDSLSLMQRHGVDSLLLGIQVAEFLKHRK